MNYIFVFFASPVSILFGTHPYVLGSEERMTADAAAIQKLELVASLSAPLSQISTPGSSPEDLPTVLNKFHTARDKHIFRRKCGTVMLVV